MHGIYIDCLNGIGTYTDSVLTTETHMGQKAKKVFFFTLLHNVWNDRFCRELDIKKYNVSDTIRMLIWM